MKYLGPVSSPSGSRILYVSLQNQLNTTETLSSIDSLTSDDTSLTISSQTITTGDITTSDGTVLPANQTVQFRAAATVEKTNTACLTLQYTTDLSNTDSTKIFVKIVPIIE